MKSRRTRWAASPETSSGFSKFFGSLLTQGDLSRLGRNYIEMGRYLEQIFLVMNIRFIAINDAYDTALSNDGTDSMVIPFKNLLNDSYCRDISMKVRSQFKMKM